MKSIAILFISLLFASNIAYSQKYKIVKEADWVSLLEIPRGSSVAKYDISSGYYTTLADYQVNLDENAFYNHDVTKVLSYSGITNASQLLVTFDTSYQKLKIHHLYVWRNGVKIDRTNSLSFEIMNNEYDLHNGIYMGRITAYDNLIDIRKDDLIDFAYTLTGKNPIFKNSKYLFIPLETSNPVDLYSVRVLYSKDKDYSYECVDCDSSIKFTSASTPKYREISMTIENGKATKLEKNIPSWIIPYKYFTLSSFKTWKDVNTWAQGVFTLSVQPNLQGVFKEIFTGNETRDEKINKIINYVQDDIRYMGIEAGIGSIKPFPPDQVVKQRFGDCKDKSLLMVSLLKKIGITKAYPVLVNVGMQNTLAKFYPGNEVFNHCIVTFEIDSVAYWVDPTIMQQGSDYKNVSLVDYGRALIIGKPSDSLARIPPRNMKSAVKIKEELTVKSFTEPSTLEIKSTRYGFEADRRRIDLERHGTADFVKAVSEDLKLIYPSVNQAADVTVKDDASSNIISITYHYDVDGFWKDGDKEAEKKLAGYWMFKFEPRTVYDYLNMFITGTRKFDYAIPYPMNLNYQIIFHFPDDMLIYDRYVKHDNATFFFDEKTEQLSSNSFQVTYHFNTKAPFVPAADYEKVCEEKNKVLGNLPIIIYFDK